MPYCARATERKGAMGRGRGRGRGAGKTLSVSNRKPLGFDQIANFPFFPLFLVGLCSATTGRKPGWQFKNGEQTGEHISKLEPEKPLLPGYGLISVVPVGPPDLFAQRHKSSEVVSRSPADLITPASPRYPGRRTRTPPSKPVARAAGWSVSAHTAGHRPGHDGNGRATGRPRPGEFSSLAQTDLNASP